MLCVPLLAIVGVLVGPSEIQTLADDYEAYMIPVMMVAVLFALYTAWMAASALIIAEETGPADRAVRWERTMGAFMAIYFWPFGLLAISIGEPKDECI